MVVCVFIWTNIRILLKFPVSVDGLISEVAAGLLNAVCD